MCESHENADSTTFSVRGIKYAADRKKEKSNKAFYQCADPIHPLTFVISKVYE